MNHARFLHAYTARIRRYFPPCIEIYTRPAVLRRGLGISARYRYTNEIRTKEMYSPTIAPRPFLKHSIRARKSVSRTTGNVAKRDASPDEHPALVAAEDASSDELSELRLPSESLPIMKNVYLQQCALPSCTPHAMKKIAADLRLAIPSQQTLRCLRWWNAAEWRAVCN